MSALTKVEVERGLHTSTLHPGRPIGSESWLRSAGFCCRSLAHWNQPLGLAQKIQRGDQRQQRARNEKQVEEHADRPGPRSQCAEHLHQHPRRKHYEDHRPANGAQRKPHRAVRGRQLMRVAINADTRLATISQITLCGSHNSPVRTSSTLIGPAGNCIVMKTQYATPARRKRDTIPAVKVAKRIEPPRFRASVSGRNGRAQDRMALLGLEVEQS